MPYLTKAELLKMLVERRHKEVVENHLIAGVPFVFKESAKSYDKFVETLAGQFQTPKEDVSLIGSARIGFSINPDKFPAAFRPASDVDAVVVNAEKFDKAWFELSGIGRRRFGMERKVQIAYQEHRENNVFFGFIVPDRLPGIVTLSPIWFFGLQLVGRQVREVSGRKINGRLYRTWEHVRAHQLYSLESIEAKFAK